MAGGEFGVCKLLMIGDSGVGKSSILTRFVDDRFDEASMDPTIGVDFKVKMYDVPDEEDQRLKLTIWDTAGQERFRTLTSAYYRGAHGIILVYDVGRRESFEALGNIWLKEIELYSTYPNAVKLLIGNKIDQETREVTKAEGDAFAREHATLFVECSAKTKVGIEQVFAEAVTKILETPSMREVVCKTQAKAGVALGQQNASDAGGGGGCGC